tara:strand:+ start:425 stop:604 length:180 start_codon:yes stop_codon:yes gene_type:complete
MVWKIITFGMTCIVIGVGGAMVGATVSSFRHYAGLDEDLINGTQEIKQVKKSKIRGGKK